MRITPSILIDGLHGSAGSITAVAGRSGLLLKQKQTRNASNTQPQALHRRQLGSLSMLWAGLPPELKALWADDRSDPVDSPHHAYLADQLAAIRNAHEPRLLPGWADQTDFTIVQIDPPDETGLCVFFHDYFGPANGQQARFICGPLDELGSYPRRNLRTGYAGATMGDDIGWVENIYPGQWFGLFVYGQDLDDTNIAAASYVAFRFDA